MTRKQFLEALTQCAGQYQWQVEADGYLRGYADGAIEYAFCPITAVAYAYERGEYGVHQVDKAGDALRLSCAAQEAIAGAADDAHGYSGILRHALLAAVGLAPDGAGEGRADG
jgi:hypothetical protein